MILVADSAADMRGDGAADGTEPMLLSERIRIALADDIASGALAPGTPLDEQQVADRHGVSRTPVREAFRQLASAGLVEIRPRRGVVVATLTPERIVDMFEMSAEIEAMCVRLATYRMNPMERSRLRQLHEESEAMVANGDFDAYDQFNQRFHEAIYRATHNGFIAEQAMALRERMAAFRRVQLHEQGRPERSRHEHGEIMEAIMRGDGEEAASCMRAHMLNASIALERYVAAHAAAGPAKD